MAEANEHKDRLRRAEALFRSGRLAESQALYERLVNSPFVAPRAKSGLGLLFLQSGRRTDAEAMFRSVIDSGRPVAESYYGLGVLTEKQDPAKARSLYEFALGINPKNGGSLARLRKLTAGSQRPVREPQAVRSAQPQRNKEQDPSAAPALKSSPKIPANSELRIKGVATAVRQRSEQQGNPPRLVNIIEFRLERSSALPPVQVHMSGHHVVGTVREGDEIRLGRQPRDGAIYHADQIENLSANAPVSVSGMGLTESDTFGKLAQLVIFLIVVGLLVGFLSLQR